MTTPPYYGRPVAAHGSDSASVLLSQEAPGPDEDAAAIPSVGRQGNNFYRSACAIGVSWALSLQLPDFVWPCCTPDDATLEQLSTRKRERLLARLAYRHLLLEERRMHITFFNAYDRWPKPSPDALKGFLMPRNEDILSKANYMGHTRRWRLGEKKALLALKEVAGLVGWMS